MAQILNPDNYAFTIHALSSMLVGMAIAVLGLYVLIRERGSRIGVVFWIFSASICSWLVAIGAAYASLYEPQAIFWIQFSIIGTIFIPVTALTLVFTIVRRVREFRRIIWAGVALSILFCLGAAFTELFIRRVHYYFWGYYPQYGPLGALFILYFFGVMVSILRLFWIEYQGSTNDRHKKRLKGLLIAFSIGYLASADFLTTVGVPAYPFGFIPIIPFLFITAYVIMRYRLVDITPELVTNQILENMQGAVIVVDLEGKVRVTSRVAEEMLGYQKSELLGMAIGSILPALMEYNATALTSGKSSSYEMTWHGRHGQLFSVSVSVSTIMNAMDNSPVGIIYVAYDITERRRVQDELKFRNLILSTQQETSLDGILVVNDVAIIISYNQRFIDLWKIPPDMASARDDAPVLQLVTSQTADPAGFLARVKYLYEHKEEKSHEEILLKDGRVFDRYSAPMFASNGKYYGRVWYFRDITERKKAEERLIESLSLKRATLESTADGILVINGQGEIVDFNNKFMELWGIPPALMEQQDDGRLIEHVLSQLKDPGPFVHKVKELYDNPDAENLDEVQFRDGRIFERYSIPHRLNGKSVGRVWSFRDVSERKRAEEELKKSEEEARQLAQENSIMAEIGRIINSTLNIDEIYGRFAEEARKLIPLDRIAIYVINHEERTYSNAYAYTTEREGTRRTYGDVFSLSGTISEEILRTRSSVLIQGEDLKKITDRFPNSLALLSLPGAQSLMSLPLFYKDIVIGILHVRSLKPNAYTEKHLKLAARIGNQIVSAIANVQLFKERKRAEEDLKTFAAKLEQSNRELQDFAYIASHDLQEPLRKVTAFGNRLMVKFGDALDEQGRDYLDRMRNAATRMQTLINGLLMYSRVSTKAQPFELVDLAIIANEVLSDLEVRIEQVQGKVEIGDLPAVQADPLQMRQLFQNLIGNALKFHAPGKAPFIKVSSRRIAGEHQGPDGNGRPGSSWQITFQDNGIGFDEKYVDRIFGVFQRLQGRSEYEGSGIGLAICRKIVQLHGGVITAKSAPGTGAAFIVTLPISNNTQERT